MQSDILADGFNYSYRFVYFPSEDSLVINAYHVRHLDHPVYGNAVYTDTHSADPYLPDGVGNLPYYYGLYNKKIQDQLIVRYQDLSPGAEGPSMMTIDYHPSNVRIFFGVNGCVETRLDAWSVPKGLYTIWDKEGRCLGVRIYNGSYSPQWIKLEEGECPDRIPSYQWVIESSDASNTRVNIRNREFGHLPSSMVAMLNVLVKREESQIFLNQGQFLYDPIVANYPSSMQYEPINYGYVKGILLPALDASDCGITDKSGFRPVTNVFAGEEYLGYKHFYVNKTASDAAFGKSEDNEDEKGMDYNAYAFNYLHYTTEEGYINMTSRFGDSLLHIADKELGFQFRLGTNLRNANYQEEQFGYPTSTNGWGNIQIADTYKDYKDYPNSTYRYRQGSIPVLSRYYYELKVADFYNFRDGLAEQYVVLKGAKNDGSDRKNALRYGVADVFADREPFKFANVYLRETYFLPRDKRLNEERPKYEQTRRIYYTLLDRIEAAQMEELTSIQGFETSDTLRGADGTSTYGLVMVKVDDGIPSFLKAQGKTVSSGRASAFSLTNVNYPLYRRLRSIEHDGAEFLENSTNPRDLDAPKTLRIHREYNHAEYLHEDVLSDKAFNFGINFLGLSNSVVNEESDEAKGSDGMVKYNYHLFIDTAYINRGTGLIKPQYLIAVDEEIVDAPFIINGKVDSCGTLLDSVEIRPYVKARYLVNATDSARLLQSNGSDGAPKRDERYIFDGSWDRLAFVPAIHADDRLYIISELEKYNITENDYIEEDDLTQKRYVNTAKLKELTKTLPARTPSNSAVYGTYYDFGVWNNYHNDVSFSLRFTHPNVENPDTMGIDDYTNYDKRFYIESETTKRTVPGSPKIAPVQGGWIKLQNFVPVLSRTSYQDAIRNAEVFNVERKSDWQGGKATPNETLTGNVAVVAGIGEVVILNAAGKKVSISNLLGQSLVNKELKSNNETISIAKGVVVVNVEGEAIKAIVK
jgi:hypothetical protein